MFSELVDRAVHLAGRPDALEDMAYFANETHRDMSKRDDFPSDLHEEIVTVTSSDGTLHWTPEVGRPCFRRMQYIEYGDGCEPTFVQPSRRIKKLCDYYYQHGNSFGFAGANGTVKIAYYKYQPWLQYYPKGTRPAVYDPPTCSFQPNTDAAIALVSNWQLERHNKAMLSGTLAAFFSSKQDPRQGVHYSDYEQRITHLIRAEGVSQLAANRHG